MKKLRRGMTFMEKLRRRMRHDDMGGKIIWFLGACSVAKILAL
jgi:hypothetical protein